MKIKYTGLLVLFCLLLSCDIEDFKKELPIGDFDSTPRLVASAALDNNMFYIFLNRSFPISSTEVKITFVEKAVVRLYEDDVLILEANKRDEFPDYSYPSLYLLREGIKTTPGKTYRLEVESGDFPPIVSTVIAPELPDVGVVNLNTKDRIKPPNSIFSYFGYYEYFYPLNIELTDRANKKNYYSIEAYRNKPDFFLYSEIGIATNDRVLIQDNPIIEAADVLLDTDYSMFLFDKFLISDLSFSGKNINLGLLLGDDGLISNYYPGHGKPPTDSVEINLYIKSIIPEVFDYYRAYMLQDPENEGTKFFNEPVVIQSNIKNGYGYFSVTSHVTKKLHTTYYYH